MGAEFFARPILPPHEGELMGTRFRALETPSNAAGPREPGAAPPRCALVERRPGGENGLRCFPDRGALGLLLAARVDFPFAQCTFQKLVLGRRCVGASALSGRAGSGCMAGAWAQKPSRAQSCFPTKENPWGLPFERLRSPAKQQGPGSHGQPRPALP